MLAVARLSFQKPSTLEITQTVLPGSSAPLMSVSKIYFPISLSPLPSCILLVRPTDALEASGMTHGSSALRLGASGAPLVVVR